MQLNDEVIKIIFGLKIRQLRQEKSLSLTELAKLSGFSLSYLNEIEKGKKYPKASKIMALAEPLGVSYDHLVSLKLNRNLAPLGELLQSNVFKELPLEMFGLQLNKVIEVITGEPNKVNTFITTMLEIARNYNLNQEKFYMAALRSYQEAHDNFFEDLEDAADDFAKLHHLHQTDNVHPSRLEDILKKSFGYKIESDTLHRNERLKLLRSLVIEGKQPILLLNQELNESQKTFTLAREIAYKVLGFDERALTSSWYKITSFDQILNHFKASYFAGALLLRRERILPDIQNFFESTHWDEEAFLKLSLKYTQSPETFMYRLTNLLPRYFDLKNIFFLRFNSRDDARGYYLTKELHLSQLHSPHGNEKGEHYCRRWISLNVLKKLDKMRLGGEKPQFIIGAQKSQYSDSKNNYMIIAAARPGQHTEQTDCSVSIGFLINKTFKEKIKFWSDPQITTRTVNETCERCSISNCVEREAAPIVLEGIKLEQALSEEVGKLSRNWER